MPIISGISPHTILRSYLDNRICVALIARAGVRVHYTN